MPDPVREIAALGSKFCPVCELWVFNYWIYTPLSNGLIFQVNTSWETGES